MLPVVVGNKRTANWIFVNSILLVGSSLLPWIFGELGAIYGAGAALTGAYLLYWNVRLLQRPEQDVAMKNFFASMKYLMALFIAVIMDVHLPL